MIDQRVEGGASFDRKNTRDGMARRRKSPEPIDRFCAKSDNTATFDEVSGTTNPIIADIKPFSERRRAALCCHEG
ncbi:hypothetical protein AA15669_0532 [Saccharibacter floricola DSM 15669]|uniref:Uncharacterized protein n=1 Tax=Saccharibacter floricola DSM 15669 TaxID=1123227 RepID=A0ABQ0NXE2_9PROT|nr:hypothetical protein AA15669_0532 [Saccharibacter floricola DSM 15669]